MTRTGSRLPDEAAFAEFVHVAWPTLFRTALLLTGDHALAEDLTQSALSTTYSRWHRLRDPAAARGYARRVLVNGTTSWFRRPSNRAERPTEFLPEDVSGYDTATQATDRVAVLHALAQLPPRQRATVVLRYYEDLSVQETAATLNVSVGTVKSQTSAALSKLRDLLGDAEFEATDDITPTTTMGGPHA